MSANEDNQYVLGMKENGTWVARRLKPEMGSAVVAADSSIDDLVAKCEQDGLVMVGVTEKALDELYIHVSKVIPVLEWLKATFPKHIQEKGATQRGSIGFRRP